MTLTNLLGISLDRLVAERARVARLMAAVERNIADAQLPGLSSENRFDAAYKAIMQLATVALNANGYRTLTSKLRPPPDDSAIPALDHRLAAAQGHHARCLAQAAQPG